MLTRWTQDGDDQGAPDLDTPRPKRTPTSAKKWPALEHGPDHRHAEGTLARGFGGFDKAADRILYLLQELPDGTPTTADRPRRD